MEPPDGLLLLDACCLINLYATGCLREILVAQGVCVGVVDVVAGEALFVQTETPNEGGEDRERIDLAPLVADGALRILAPDTDEEYEAFINYAAAGLDDGEALTLALAQTRACQVATDDQRARREAHAVPSLVCQSTVTLLQRWVETCAVAPPALAAVLCRIERLARFRSGRREKAEQEWWDRARGKEAGGQA